MGRATGSPTRRAGVTRGPVSVAPRRTARVPAATEDLLPLEAVGRVGELCLDYERQGARTVLARARCRSPWHVLPPMSLDEPGWAYSLLVNPSGGLVGGDRLSVKLTAGSDSRVLVSTPSATRIYRSTGAPAEQRITLRVQRGSVLEWIPEVTIPYAGSRFQQTIQATVEPGATLLVWDAFASGRIARKERWAFAQFDNEVRISVAGGGTVLERARVRQDEQAWDSALVRDWDYVGTCYLIHDGLEGDQGASLRRRLGDLLDRGATGILGGVSEPCVPGVVIKLVARTALDLFVTFEALWGAIRAQLWGLPVARLRRY